jgi:hypothetical protein
MSLKHDPSAIRYASTQEAYGTTWTLDSTEDDGTQVWKNAKGQTALVQKAVEQVRQQLPASPVWKLMDIGQTKEQLGNMTRKPISADRLKKAITITNVIPESYVADYSKLDAEIGQRLMEKGFFVDWHKAEKACASGRVSSTEPNQSNQPKTEQKYGYYSAKADAKGVGVCQYLTPQGSLVAVTCVGTEGTAWPDEVCLGPVTKCVKTISESASRHQRQMTNGYYYDRCLTNEEIASIWNNGHDSVPGGKKMF